MRDDRGFTVNADILAEAFGLSEPEVKAAMRGGLLTSRCEVGVEDDAGKWRLTFHFQDRALRLILDETGEILKRVSFPVTTKATPDRRTPAADGA